MDFRETIMAEGKIGAAIRRHEDMEEAIRHQRIRTIFLLNGDINKLPALVNRVNKAGKAFLVHIDLVEGIGKDAAGIHLLKRMGVAGVVTTKSNLVKYAKDEGLLVIQRLFIVDSESLKTGIRVANNVKPSAVEILPATIPAYVVNDTKKALNLPILGGGLLKTKQDVAEALEKGIDFISTSRRDLWEI